MSLSLGIPVQLRRGIHNGDLEEVSEAPERGKELLGPYSDLVVSLHCKGTLAPAGSPHCWSA